ncbi:MAG TPA: tryptophan--tRNA ligase [Acidimicrobiales bacterium]|nr:tryptophan--tRNA ligase [Acidimicrobiales bacterium]
MPRVLSGIQPSGDVHLGNLLGAIRNWVRDQHDESFHLIVDLHALTLPKDPAELRSGTLELAMTLIAAGLDPDVCTLFVQSHVPAHSNLSWLLECTVSFGELRRMTQFKDKSDRADFISAGLFTYPALQAADILLYDAERVPVGDDQLQHIEITRDIAVRFNSRYGETFVIPEAVIPAAGARVMDLQNPTKKMSKSESSPQGTIDILEPLKSIERKIMRAVTDSDTDVRFDTAAKPGVANLLSILAACAGGEPAAIAASYSQYGALKKDTAAAVIETVRPIQQRFAELASDPAETARLLDKGARKAEMVASVTLTRAYDAIGLLPRGKA